MSLVFDKLTARASLLDIAIELKFVITKKSPNVLFFGYCHSSAVVYLIAV